MPAIACAVSWRDPLPAAVLSEGWRAVADRGDAACEIGGEGVVMGALPGWAADAANRECSVWSAEDRSLFTSFDGRLDSAAGWDRAAEPVSAAEWIARLYAGQGAQFAASLRGDFAAIVWDRGKGLLLGVRDPFGVRPLFWRRLARGAAIATDPRQLLAFDAEPGLDAAGLAAYLAGHFVDPEATFHRGIRRAPPGAVVAISQGGVEVNRYWTPPLAGPGEAGRAGAGEEAYRKRLEEAVGRRLRGSGPAILHLSGGLDSSALCLLARPEAGSRYLAELYPGAAAIDRPAIEAVAKRLSFPGDMPEIQAAAPGGLGPRNAATPLRLFVPGGSVADLEAARAGGARTILSGVGGDELCFESGIFGDLGATSQWLELIRQIGAYRSVPLARRWSALRRALSASPAGALARRAGLGGRRRTNPAPGWAAPPLAEVLREPAGVELREKPEDASYTAWNNWAYLTHPRLTETLETLELHSSSFQTEYVFPYLDADLVECVLQLPFQERLSYGQQKRFPRRALDGILPPEIASPAAQADLSGFVGEAFLLARPWIERILGGAEWASGGWIFQQGARALLDDANWRQGVAVWRTAWKIAILEVWLRESSGAGRV